MFFVPVPAIDSCVEERAEFSLTIRYIFGEPVCNTDESVEFANLVFVISFIVGADDAFEDLGGLWTR